MTRKINRSEWKEFFDYVTKTVQPRLTEIEAAGLEIGDQIAAEKLAINGVTYDEKDDSVFVDSDTLEHRIPSPKEIYAEGADPEIKAIYIMDKDDTLQIIRFASPLLLPAPKSAA